MHTHVYVYVSGISVILRVFCFYFFKSICLLCLPACQPITLILIHAHTPTNIRIITQLLSLTFKHIHIYISMSVVCVYMFKRKCVKHFKKLQCVAKLKRFVCKNSIQNRQQRNLSYIHAYIHTYILNWSLQLCSQDYDQSSTMNHFFAIHKHTCVNNI